MDNDSLQTLCHRLEQFRDDRDWEQFHSPKNLIMAINGEAGELASVAQWRNNSEIFTDVKLQNQVTTEMADVFIYLVNLANVLEIDLIEAANLKIDDNGVRYPISKFKGIADKAGE